MSRIDVTCDRCCNYGDHVNGVYMIEYNGLDPEKDEWEWVCSDCISITWQSLMGSSRPRTVNAASYWSTRSWPFELGYVDHNRHNLPNPIGILFSPERRLYLDTLLGFERR